MWDNIQLWDFLAGLGLFLLGMLMLEQGLKGLGSRSLKNFLRVNTRSPVRGVITGTFATAFLQSSSLVGLVILAFIGAGMLELRNAMGVIFGSNLGTTFTGWIVTAVGFKMDLANFAQPILAAGAFGTVFLKNNEKPYYYSNILLGLGLLLLGLTEMKGGFASLTDNVDVSIFRGYNPIVYLIAGALFTAIIQSSSATMMILLSALHADVIKFQDAAAIVIGADLGTTSTIFLGALKGTVDKRRVACAHLFFNLGTDMLAFLCLPLLLYFIIDVLSMQDPLYSLVTFHSLFNILGIIIFLPLTDRFIRFLKWLIKEDKQVALDECGLIDRVPANVTDAAIEAVRQELKHLLVRTIELNLRCFKINAGKVLPEELSGYNPNHASYEDRYANLKRNAGKILGYTYLVQKYADDEEDSREITELNHAVRNTAYSAKFIKDIRHNLFLFRQSTLTEIKDSRKDIKSSTIDFYHQVSMIILNKNPELTIEHLLLMKKSTRGEYENILQTIYFKSGEDQIQEEETSSLLNVNRAVYLSHMSLLESARVYLQIEESIVDPEIPIMLQNP
jgi:phosphate:Na+ symporter